MSYDLTQLLNLDTKEKLALIDALYDSMQESVQVTLTPEQEAELAQRREEYLRDPDNVYTWEEVREFIRNRHE